MQAKLSTVTGQLWGQEMNSRTATDPMLEGCDGEADRGLIFKNFKF